MRQCFAKTTNATNGTGTRFNHPFGGNAAWSTTQDQHRTPVPAAGTFLNLRVRCKTGLAASSSRTFFLYKNGTVTGQGVTIGASDTTIHSDIVNTVTVAAGDSIAIGSTLTGTDANVIVDIAIEFESTDDNVSVYGGPHVPLSNTTVFHNITAMDSTDATALGIDDSQSIWPVAGVFTRWDVRLLTAPGSTHSRTFHIYKNGTAQDGTGGTPNTTITITGAATTGTASFSLTVAEGDLLSWRAAVSGSPAGSTPCVGFTLTATTDGQWAICASDEDQYNAATPTFLGQGPLNWDSTEASVAMIGNITTWQLTGWRLQQALADNGRSFRPAVDGTPTGPSGTLAGGAVTLVGSGDPAIITSANTWAFETTPGASGRVCIVGFQGSAQEDPRPGPIVNGPFLRFARIGGGMVN